MTFSLRLHKLSYLLSTINRQIATNTHIHKHTDNNIGHKSNNYKYINHISKSVIPWKTPFGKFWRVREEGRDGGLKERREGRMGRRVGSVGVINILAYHISSISHKHPHNVRTHTQTLNVWLYCTFNIMLCYILHVRFYISSNKWGHRLVLVSCFCAFACISVTVYIYSIL